MLNQKNKTKIFCIGLHKTGTTTIETVLQDFGFQLGNQTQGELLLDNWYNRDFKSIIQFCKTAEAFQDTPFSLPYTYIPLDQKFNNAKFILTERDNPEQWYKSITTFHSKKWADGCNIPTLEQLKEATYRYKGYAYDFNRKVFSTPEDEPYQKKDLINYYCNHNKAVKEYFKSNPKKLIVINVNIKEHFRRLADFLGKNTDKDSFPWKNKT